VYNAPVCPGLLLPATKPRRRRKLAVLAEVSAGDVMDSSGHQLPQARSEENEGSTANSPSQIEARQAATHDTLLADESEREGDEAAFATNDAEAAKEAVALEEAAEGVAAGAMAEDERALGLRLAPAAARLADLRSQACDILLAAAADGRFELVVQDLLLESAKAGDGCQLNISAGEQRVLLDACDASSQNCTDAGLLIASDSSRHAPSAPAICSTELPEELCAVEVWSGCSTPARLCTPEPLARNVVEDAIAGGILDFSHAALSTGLESELHRLPQT